jgi:hypothetical protein
MLNERRPRYDLALRFVASRFFPDILKLIQLVGCKGYDILPILYTDACFNASMNARRWPREGRIMSRCYSVVVAFLAVMALSWASAGRLEAAASPSVTITIDDSVVTQLLRMIASHDDSDDSINSWMALPGNNELLSVGLSEGELTRDQLRANVKAVVDGDATDESQPKYSFGRVIASPPADYQRMIDELHANARQWLIRCANRDTAFAPAGATVNQVVYLHLGGDWDAINRDGAIYINMQFFHDYFTPSWYGLNLLIAHETFHAVQNTVFGNPEADDTADDAFYTALSKIQREGMARYVEVETDPEGYMPGTYGFYFRAVDEENLRLFPVVMPLVGDLAGACYPQFDKQSYADMVGQGLGSGGPYYAVGEGMAQAIDRYDGRKRLIETVQKGPLDFFDCYAAVAREHRELPQVAGAALAHVEDLRARYPGEKLPVPNAAAVIGIGVVGSDSNR